MNVPEQSFHQLFFFLLAQPAKNQEEENFFPLFVLKILLAAAKINNYH